jgi:hypothetical protein
MQVVHFSGGHAEAIEQFGSVGASAVPLGHGEGAAHVYAVHLGPGACIGPHPAGFAQLFLAVRGRGWVAGADGRRVPIEADQGAFIAPGEVHAKGSDDGMVAIMVQVSALRVDAAAGGADQATT